MTARRRRWSIAAVASLATIGAVWAGVNAWRLRSFRRMAIPDIDARDVSDGHYRATATCGIRYEVEVAVEAGRIVAARELGPPGTRYHRLGSAVLTRVLAEQTPAVDAVSGATTTSKCLLRGVASALAAAPRHISTAALTAPSNHP